MDTIQLSNPFVGFLVPVVEKAVIKALPFNSLCWVQVKATKKQVLKMLNFQFPLLGSNRNGYMGGYGAVHFQFPLLGSAVNL